MFCLLGAAPSDFGVLSAHLGPLPRGSVGASQRPHCFITCLPCFTWASQNSLDVLRWNQEGDSPLCGWGCGRMQHVSSACVCHSLKEAVRFDRSDADCKCLVPGAPGAQLHSCRCCDVASLPFSYVRLPPPSCSSISLNSLFFGRSLKWWALNGTGHFWERRYRLGKPPDREEMDP